MEGKRKDTTKELLEKIYSTMSLPVLFITKSLRLYYCNAVASMYYPKLCRPMALKPYITVSYTHLTSVLSPT